jgi:hypothetical protein
VIGANELKTETYTCDRCVAAAEHAVSVYWYELPMTQQSYDLTVRDLCPACAAELRRWLEGGETDGSVPTR